MYQNITKLLIHPCIIIFSFHLVFFSIFLLFTLFLFFSSSPLLSPIPSAFSPLLEWLGDLSDISLSIQNSHFLLRCLNKANGSDFTLSRFAI